MLGYSSHVLPAKRRPARFFRFPPHCLKKNATRYRPQLLRSSSTHQVSMGRARGPDSPPTIAQ